MARSLIDLLESIEVERDQGKFGTGIGALNFLVEKVVEQGAVRQACETIVRRGPFELTQRRFTFSHVLDECHQRGLACDKRTIC